MEGGKGRGVAWAAAEERGRSLGRRRPGASTGAWREWGRDLGEAPGGIGAPPTPHKMGPGGGGPRLWGGSTPVERGVRDLRGARP